MGYLNNFPIPEIPGIRSDSKMDIQIRFTDIYRNPSRLLISSRADMGKIRRRIDAEVYINKVSKVYDSFLLNKALLIGNDYMSLMEATWNLSAQFMYKEDCMLLIAVG